jgi:hypothetical protein
VQFGNVSRDSIHITIEVGEKSYEDVNHIDLAHDRQSRFHEEKEILGQLNNHKCLNPLAYTDVCETARLARSINTQPAVRRNSDTNPTSHHKSGMY